MTMATIQRQIADLLGKPKKTLLDYRRIGGLVARYVEEGQRGQDNVEELARRVGVSESTLRVCYRMARYWDQETTREAQKEGVGLLTAVTLIALESAAARMKGTQVRRLRDLRGRLIRDIGRGKITTAEVKKRVREALDEVRSGYVGYDRRRIQDAKRVCAGALMEVMKRLREIRGYVVRGQRKRVDEMVKRAKGLADDVDGLRGR